MTGWGPALRRAGRVGLVALAWFGPDVAYASGLDWEAGERNEVAAPVRVLRNVRDGVLGVGDALLEGNTALFGEFSLLLAKLTMAASDAVGLVDDNAVSQHVTRAFFSKHLAKTAYFWHVAGSETLLGGHDLEVQRWAIGEVAQLNPLLGEADVEALEGPLPLDPLDFVGEGLHHPRVLRTHSSALGVGAIVVSDAVLRPFGGLLRILQLPRWGETLETRGNELFRSATRFEW